jgi:hypothetical protein
MHTREHARAAGGPLDALSTEKQRSRDTKSRYRKTQAVRTFVRTAAGRRAVVLLNGGSGWLTFVSNPRSGMVMVGGHYRTRRAALAGARKLAMEG